MGKVAVSRMPCFPDHSFFSDTRVTNWHFVHYIKRKSEPNSRGSTQDYLFRPAFKHRGCPKNLGSIHTWLKHNYGTYKRSVVHPKDICLLDKCTCRTGLM